MLSMSPHIAVGGHVLKRFWKDEGAAVGTEYALLLSVLAMGMALAVFALSDSIILAYTGVTDILSQSGCDNNGAGIGDGGGAGGGDGQGSGSGEGNTC